MYTAVSSQTSSIFVYLMYIYKVHEKLLIETKKSVSIHKKAMEAFRKIKKLLKSMSDSSRNIYKLHWICYKLSSEDRISVSLSKPDSSISRGNENFLLLLAYSNRVRQ